MWSLEPTKTFAQDYEITQFFLALQLFVYYGTPDVLVNVVAAYHHLDGERSVQHYMSRKVQISPTCVPGVWLEGPKFSKIRTSKLYSKRKFDIT